MTNQAFDDATGKSTPAKAESLQEFAQKRSEFLLNHKEIKALGQ